VTVSQTIRITDDLAVHRLGFGALHLSGPGVWGPPADPAAAKRLLHRALELGVNFIDTADTYGGSEDVIASALHPYPDELVIATKGGLERDGPEVGGFTPWPRNGRPEQIKRACESSLRRLRLDCITLYQLHSPDPKVPYVESLGALKELQEHGKVRHVGVSNVNADQLEVALGELSIVSVQNEYSVTNREHEPVLERCERAGITFIPWFPLGGGDGLRDGAVLARVANAHRASLSQIAIAWLLHRSPRILPIPGTSSPAHLEENCAATELEFAPEEVAELSTLT
jgi:aryl-alcohol dehydrogenase-like predicted oxidoreductase